MRIAILSQYFDPEPSCIKLSTLVKRLVSAGHDVQVLTSLPNLPLGKLYKGYHYTFWHRETRMGASVTRAFVWPYRGNRLIKRFVHFLSFMVSVTICGLTLKPFDLLYVYHPPLTIVFPALVLSWVYRVRFLYDVQDLWPEAGIAAGAIRPGLLTRIMHKIAGLAYSRAKHLTVIAPEFKEVLADLGTPSNKISVIPNWTDEVCYYPRPAAGVRERYGLPEGVFLVMYAGNFGSSHGVGCVLESAKLLRNNPGIAFAFLGSGAEYPHLRHLAAEMGLPNVHFLGYIDSNDEMPYLFSAADIMVVHLRGSTSGAVSLPSRMASYMACARPILVASRGAPKNLVEAAGCGLTCEPDDPEALAAAILAVSRRSDLAALGASGRRYYFEHLCEQISSDRLVRLIEQLCVT